MMNEDGLALPHSSFSIPHSSFHCGGHWMTLPRSGLEGGGGAVGRGVGAGRASVSGARAVRSTLPRVSGSAFGSSSPSRAGFWAADASPLAGFLFARAGSSAAGASLSETTISSFGMFDCGGRDLLRLGRGRRRLRLLRGEDLRGRGLLLGGLLRRRRGPRVLARAAP